MIPLSVPSIKGNEWKYVKDCLDTEWVSSAGKYVDLFEQKIAEYTSSRYAVACINGTSAIHISLLIAGVQPGDEVIVPTLTFIAPVNAIRYCNAYPVFMDSDEYYNINSQKTRKFILDETKYKNGFSYNKVTGRKVSAIIPVHVFGNAVWMDEIFELCVDRGIKIIEDSTESLGSRYIKGKFKGKHTGTIGDLGCLSFNGNKIITTGGGGMILTDNEEYADKAKYLTTQAKDDEVRFIHSAIGYNFRLTNIQAAMGVAQLERLEEYLQIKNRNFEAYRNSIEKINGLELKNPPPYADNNKWMYSLQIDKENYGRDRDELISFLSMKQVQTRPVWYLNHLQKPYVNFQKYKIEIAQNLFDKTVNIPCSVNLKEDEINQIITLLKNE